MLLPASVVTMPLLAAGAAPGPATTSAAACADAAPCASPAAPHSSTPAHVAGAAHLTHALTLHATLPPLGSAPGALAPATSRCVPLAITSAPFAFPNISAAYVGAAPVNASAATPSACEPER